MRVTYLINGLGAGGAERSLADLVTPLRQRGVELSVICLTLLREGVHDELVRDDVEITTLAATSFVGRVREVRRLLRRRRPDVLHTTLFDSDVIGRLAAWGTGIPVVASVVNTSYDEARRRDPRVNLLALRVYQQVDAVTARRLTCLLHAVSHSVARATERDLRIASGRIRVIPRGRDPRRLGEPSLERRLSARRALRLDDSETVLVHVGRQEWVKGLDVLLPAVGELARRGIRVRLVQAGRAGAATKDVQSLVGQLGLEESVLQLGHRGDIADVLAAGDVFVFPSRYEGMPGSVLEAMALGLPVVASAIPPVQEIVDETCAQLVPVDDPAALADALEAVLSDGDRRARMAASARQRFLGHFTLETVADMTAAFYHEAAALGQGPGSAAWSPTGTTRSVPDHASREDEAQ